MDGQWIFLWKTEVPGVPGGIRTVMSAMKRYEHPAIESIGLSSVMAALADPYRLKIVAELLPVGRSLACNEVFLPVSKATRSHHFEVLRDAGLIATCVEGTKCMTSLRREALERRFPGLIALLEAEVATRTVPAGGALRRRLLGANPPASEAV